MPKTYFSVKFLNPKYPDEIWAADWGFHKAGGWSLSYSLKGRMTWTVAMEEFDELAHLAILEKFGLLAWKAEYSWARVEAMSPAMLIKERREKEEEQNLPRLEAVSDNICDKPVRAEEYD